MNKKGLDAMKTVGGIILILALLGVYLYFVSGAADAGGGIMNIFRTSQQDFDGDGIPDATDPCPCGSPPNENNKQVNIAGVTYCVLSNSPCYDVDEDVFQTREYSRVEGQEPQELCTYRRPECLEFIERQTS